MITQFSDSSEYSTEENAGRDKLIRMFVYWTASTVFDSRCDSGKPWFDVEQTNGAGGFCYCDEVEMQSDDKRKKERKAE